MGRSKKARKFGKVCIVKRRGHCEAYDERKVYGSCYFACRSSHLGEIESEKICSRVCKSISRIIKNKKEITSNSIFKYMVRELKKHDKDMAFMYETHRDIS
ncbi:hypothetical protein HYU10_04460 [Candidatus Woesearchaeota archaeon]|nr:hypothetical protein [Candidatus Woesearchaeota archaeon]MBI2130994.1 hypothetical protein [Candidatus Woesearchaeota archaeon]MBI2660910.1 hypothetical protein [Candidatus Woesearchaeota archaeon]